jgi:hypothetical protein
MKLKSLAALLFRILGASFVLTGLADALSGILDTHKIGAIAAAIGGLVIGSLTICFSKRLADIFCRGLDDE